MTTTEAIVKALRESDLDCSMWSEETLQELAHIVIAGLQRAGYQLYEYNP